MNPFDAVNSQPNYWLSCLLIDSEAMCKQVCSEKETFYLSEKGKTCPTEILEALAAMNAEGRPIWKPMHMQPLYRMNAFVTRQAAIGQKLRTVLMAPKQFQTEILPMWPWIFLSGACACPVISK